MINYWQRWNAVPTRGNCRAALDLVTKMSVAVERLWEDFKRISSGVMRRRPINQQKGTFAMTTLLMTRMTMFAAASALAFAFSAPAFAAGSDSGSSPGNSSNDSGGKSVDKTMTKCKHGMVYSENKKKCVKANKSSMNDTQLFEI